MRLANLPGASAAYRMTSEGNPYHVGALMKGCQSPDILSLKDGATIIFTRNDPAGRFVNGTTGVVVEARGAGGWPVIELKDGAEVTAERVSWFVDELDEEQGRYVGARPLPKFRCASRGASPFTRAKACRWTRP